MSYAEEELSGTGRPRLSLQPRGSGADQVSSLPSKTSKPNPFGTARPREQVIAEREGKKETEVLIEQAQKEWKPSIVLTEAQREEKKAAEAELAFARSELSKEFDPLKSKGLKDEVASMEKKLEELLESFEKVAIQTAQTGGTRRPYERRSDDRAQGAGLMPAAPGGNYSDSQDSYSNFSRGRERDGDKGGSYGEAWGAKVGGGRSSASQCFKCGEMGHIQRDCPHAGAVGVGVVSRGNYGGHFGGGGGGGGRSSGRPCYTCGQEGHFSRECPQNSGGYGGSRSGGYGGNYGGSYGYSAQDYEAAGSYGNQGGGGYSAAYDDRYYGGVSSRGAGGGGGGGGYSAGGSRWEGYPGN